jgi:UDP-N-acetylglucosamine 2-epimerase (non-hydrolysing)
MSKVTLRPSKESGHSPQPLDSQPSGSVRQPGAARPQVLCVFGTRPEVIKLAPVLRALKARTDLDTLIVSSGQHTSLLYPFLDLFNIQLDEDLQVMQPDQTPNEVCARVMAGLDRIIKDSIIQRGKPSLILVQGDTTTALAAALTGFHHRIPVGHVEAGLRSGNPLSPFPEEMNRRLVSQVATYHFAATTGNRASLLAEGVPEASIFVTGNPVVDSLQFILKNAQPSPRAAELLQLAAGKKLIVLTTHRRESFGRVMRQHLRTLRDFVRQHDDVAAVFAVHPNPNVRAAAEAELGGGGSAGSDRIHLVEPLTYPDFIHLLQHAWLLVSDSGGIQEEAPTLHKPLLVLRSNTERPEAVECGVAILVGDEKDAQPERLRELLNLALTDQAWAERVRTAVNPFGDGDSGEKIASILHRELVGSVPHPVAAGMPASSARAKGAL